MKYSFTRKINLANIDRELWPYESEDISISDADSFEEAQQQVDKIVAERIGYYKAMSEVAKTTKYQTVPAGTAPETEIPPVPVQSAPPPPGPAPTAPINTGGETNQPPKEFQV